MLVVTAGGCQNGSRTRIFSSNSINVAFVLVERTLESGRIWQVSRSDERSHAVRSIARAILVRASRGVIPRSPEIRVMAHPITTGVSASRSAPQETTSSSAMRSIAFSRAAGDTRVYVMGAGPPIRPAPSTGRPGPGPSPAHSRDPWPRAPSPNSSWLPASSSPPAPLSTSGASLNGTPVYHETSTCTPRPSRLICLDVENPIGRRHCPDGGTASVIVHDGQNNGNIPPRHPDGNCHGPRMMVDPGMRFDRGRERRGGVTAWPHARPSGPNAPLRPEFGAHLPVSAST